jgi:hypothetical protein
MINIIVIIKGANLLETSPPWQGRGFQPMLLWGKIMNIKRRKWEEHVEKKRRNKKNTKNDR